MGECGIWQKVETGSFPRSEEHTSEPGVFLGYIKNLGTGDSVTQLYGTGTDVDQLTTVGAELTYNVAHWKFGLEYTFSSAWYGSMDTSNGKIKDTHSISNHRVVGVAMFMF